ncbi:hypothetical protein NC651_016325 [Populus alba x Populus x berolinensis]|nr:hypothetical protein NC651_016304 [Populus alba x Populus x berolinensis]KAJ6914033.1 hypothetical protein NC651_016325 [Populus alba x Populus x berolinensis]
MQHGIPGLHREKEEYTVCNTIHPPLMCAQELNIRSQESHTKIEGETTGEMDPPSHMLPPWLELPSTESMRRSQKAIQKGRLLLSKSHLPLKKTPQPHKGRR